MCKVMVFTNFSKIKDSNLKSRSEFIGNKLLKTEQDGFGYSVFGEKGIFGEKTTANYFNSHHFNKIPPISAEFVYKYNQELFGEKSKIVGGAIFHGRVSTNKLGLKNTHPINKHGWSLIHNGVVSNYGEDYTMITDNDSEHVLENLSQGGIKAVAENLTGYYAFAAFDPEGNLHIGRDSIADLYAANIPQLNSYVFATTRELITSFCEEFNYAHSPISEFNDDTYLVFNSRGELISHEYFESRGWTSYEAAYSESSLGKTLNYTTHKSSTVVDVTDIINKKYESFESSHQSYIDELRKVDSTYLFIDSLSGKYLSLDQFQKMAEEDWYTIDVVRKDGTIVDYINYDSKRLYFGD